MKFIRVIFLLMKRGTIATLLLILHTLCNAQATLTLDSCRELALRNNATIKIATEKVEAAHHERKAAFSNYFPKLSGGATYMHNQKSASLLSGQQKELLNNIGTTLVESGGKSLEEIAALFPELQNMLLLAENDIATPINNIGKAISNALTIETQNIYIAALSLEQPLFAGGKIISYNKMAKYAEELALHERETARQDIILATEEAYWQIVSVSNKRKLAESMVKLVEKLKSDVTRLKDAGVATEADILTVSVKLNEAEIALLRATNGERLARMLLSEICGLPIESTPTLADELLEFPTFTESVKSYNNIYSIENRPEIKSLQSAIKIYNQKANIVLSDYLPQAAFTANYFATSPNIINGFNNRFKGMWNVGVVLKIPFNWGEGYHKIKSARAETRIAEYTLENVRREIELQIKQAIQNSEEAYKRLTLAYSSISVAEENLRKINIEFSEGLATSSNVLEAQTAWLLAHSTLIDARIDIILAEAYLKRTLGTLK